MAKLGFFWTCLLAPTALVVVLGDEKGDQVLAECIHYAERVHFQRGWMVSEQRRGRPRRVHRPQQQRSHRQRAPQVLQTWQRRLVQQATQHGTTWFISPPLFPIPSPPTPHSFPSPHTTQRYPANQTLHSVQTAKNLAPRGGGQPQSRTNEQRNAISHLLASNFFFAPSKTMNFYPSGFPAHIGTAFFLTLSPPP